MAESTCLDQTDSGDGVGVSRKSSSWRSCGVSVWEVGIMKAPESLAKMRNKHRLPGVFNRKNLGCGQKK